MVVEEVLIVNDGSLLLKMMGGLLESKGYQLSLTDFPEEALALLSSRNIILAVFKLNGQQADRLALLHMVKELDARTRLIIMGDQASLPADAFEVEADDYLILPCRPAEIWRRLTSGLTPPASQSAVSQEDGLATSVNQGVVHKLSSMFPHMQGHEAPGPQNEWRFRSMGGGFSPKILQKARTEAGRLGFPLIMASEIRNHQQRIKLRDRGPPSWQPARSGQIT